jgi:hypothetical protein
MYDGRPSWKWQGNPPLKPDLYSQPYVMYSKMLVRCTAEHSKFATWTLQQKSLSTNATLVPKPLIICSIDIRDLITLDDAQQEMNYGPNGGLVYCMEYLIQNIDWLMEELSEFAEDSFVLFDCPG